MMTPKIAVAIVHFGELAPTRRVIESVQLGTRQPAQILVVNNGPAEWDRPLEAGVELLGPAINRGYAGAVNAAARAASASGCDALWVLNNDVWVASSALAVLSDAYQELPDADVIGSFVSRGDSIWFGGGAFCERTGRASHCYFGRTVESVSALGFRRTDWINGCSMLIPLRALEDRGYFDEHLFLYKEELEWQMRGVPARAWVVPQALVDHSVGLTTGSTEGRLGRMFMARNGLVLARRQRGLRRMRWLTAWAWDYGVKPALKRDWAALRDNLEGARLTGSSATVVLERV